MSSVHTHTDTHTHTHSQTHTGKQNAEMKQGEGGREDMRGGNRGEVKEDASPLSTTQPGPPHPHTDPPPNTTGDGIIHSEAQD